MREGGATMYIFSKERWSENRGFTIAEQIALGMFLFALFAIVALILRFYGEAAYAAIYHFFGSYQLNSLVGFVVILLGVLAAFFKQRHQSFYGLVEFVFGIISGFAVSFGMSPGKATATQWASLIACGYVIARGIGNMMDGSKAVKVAEAAHSPVPLSESPEVLSALRMDDTEVDEKVADH